MNISNDKAGFNTGFYFGQTALLLFSFRCTVYPERSEGHSCSATILFNYKLNRQRPGLSDVLIFCDPSARNKSPMKLQKLTLYSFAEIFSFGPNRR